MNLYTFGVYTEEVMRAIESGELDEAEAHAMLEEVDVHAPTRAAAEPLAWKEAHDLYGDDCTIFPMQAGGTGGYVEVQSL